MIGSTGGIASGGVITSIILSIILMIGSTGGVASGGDILIPRLIISIHCTSSSAIIGISPRLLCLEMGGSSVIKSPQPQKLIILPPSNN